MKRLLIQTIVAKEYPTCKKVNLLLAKDLIRSFYLRTPAENSDARHFCHHCHCGWNIKGFWAVISVIYLFAGYIFLANFPDLLKLINMDNRITSNNIFNFSGLLIFLGTAFLPIDFIIKAFLVDKLPAIKQTG